jgi:hypothetical protein
MRGLVCAIAILVQPIFCCERNWRYLLFNNREEPPWSMEVNKRLPKESLHTTNSLWQLDFRKLYVTYSDFLIDSVMLPVVYFFINSLCRQGLC